ncbi:hypothetical protein TSAR_002007 [Trichomalopsis sarcophagae]|uniref:Odorant receptor n=1 Tax=Trichomalopsis sarcophagae TaxID=543379 RepID=A0A232EGU6_9HYME|nr:hypothetical protein TSAR_002007 [Trichomalopsis sarcophagae]
MLDSSEVFSNKYFILNKKLLILIFIWPYQKKHLGIFVNTFIILAIHTMMIPQIIRAVLEWQMEVKNVEILIENFGGLLYFQGTLSKYYSSIYLQKKLQQLFEQITYDWKGMHDDNEKAVLLRSWNIGRNLTIFYMTYMFFACIAFVTLPSVVPLMLDLLLPLNESRQLKLCYFAEYFIDQQKYFVYLFMHTFFGVSFTILIVTAVDSTFVSIVHHALGLYKVLEYRMKNVLHLIENNYQFNSLLAKDELHKYIVDSVKIHKKTIEFSEIVQRIYSDCFFFVTILVLLFLSIVTIQLVMNLNNPPDFMRIGFMMMRCAVPCKLTAGPLLTMDLATSGNILRTAMSYFTVVASFS